MTEAELRQEADKLFREMGMADLPPDALDFFQKNPENGASSDWKKCLKSPSSRAPHRTSSAGTALVHLKKKYSTGLPEQQLSTRNIKASDIDSSSAVPQLPNRTRKISPSLKQKARFGFSSSTAKVADSTTTVSAEARPVHNSSEESTNKIMFQVRRPRTKASTTAAPVVGRHSIKGTAGSARMTSSSSAGCVSAVRPIGKTASNGAIPHGSNLPYYNNRQPAANHSSFAAKQEQANPPASNGVHSSIPKTGAPPTHTRTHSHGSAVITTANTSSTPASNPGSSRINNSIASAHGSIDTSKLSSVNMRSLTRARSVERNVPERKLSDTSFDKKHSFIPVPAQTAAGLNRISPSNAGTRLPDEVEGGRGEKSGSTTQVLYTRKPSFKIIPVSSSSHRIMHTVQDGGIPKRHNIIDRGPLPLTATGPSSQQKLVRSASGRRVLETVTLRHGKQDPQPQQSDARPDPMVYDSLVSSERHNGKGVNVSQAQRRGEYDRLSPPIQNSTAAKKEDPVYDTIDNNDKIIGGQGIKRKISDSLMAESGVDNSVAVKSLKLNSSVSATEQSGSVMRSLTLKSTSPPSTNTSPVGEIVSDEIARMGLSRHKSSRGHTSSSSSSSRNYVGEGNRKISDISAAPPIQSKPSDDKTVQQPIQRYTSESGNVYSVVSKPRSAAPLQMQTNSTPVSGNERKTSPHRQLVQSLSNQHPSIVTTPTTSSTTATTAKPHRPLQVSLSDTSSSSTHASKTPTASSESALEGSLHSSTSLNSDLELHREQNMLLPKGGSALMGSDERRAKLNFNWSQQSLDKNMREVATSTVAALSNLVDVLTSPPAHDHRDSSGDEDTTAWYLDVEGEEDNRSSGPSNPLSPVSSTTSPSTFSASSPANMKSDGDRSSPRSRQEVDIEPSVPSRSSSLSGNVSPRKNIQATSPIGIEAHVPTDSHIDGCAMSRISPRRHTVGSKPSKSSVPPVPPKSKLARQLMLSTSSAEDCFKSSIPVSHNNSSHRRAHSRGSDSAENKSSSRTTAEEPRQVKSGSRSGSGSKSNAASVSSVPGGGSELSNPLNHDYAILEGPSNHDYAVLEGPSDHDYAILDPEYHEEFYGYCASCSEPIIGMEKGCLALQKPFHIKCFTCSTCGISLSDRNFYTSQGKLLCGKDHKVTFEQCRNCKRNIHDRVIKALGFAYHPKCFRCSVCGWCLDGVPYTSDSKNKLYCLQDYHKIYARKCAACEYPIIPLNGQKKSLQVIAMNKSYHIQCYKCEECHRQLASRTGGGEKCYPLNGHLLCKTCHAQRAQALSGSHRMPAPQRETIKSH